MKKHKINTSKVVSLATLVLPLLVAVVAIMPSTAYAQDNSTSTSTVQTTERLDKVKDKANKATDTAIKRLQKVRSRVQDSNDVNKEETLNKIDKMVTFLKSEKEKISNANSVADLRNILREVRDYVKNNNLQLKGVFDKRDSKIEKMYSKMDQKLDEYTKKAATLDSDKKAQADKLISKAKGLIEQLKNEDKKDKDRLETKAERKELIKTIDELKKLVR
jgi:hypothetical protein